MPAPWCLVRARLAEAWYVPPWEVDEAPAIEIAQQLELWAIEHEHTPKDS
jgi:hypothetical protein